MSEPIILDQAVDGFSYNTNLLYLPNRYFVNALTQLDILRRANNFKARWFVIPDDIDQPIAPYDTLYFQIQVEPGAYFFGYQFSTLKATDPNGAPIATTATDILLQAVDSCPGIPLFEDFANGGGEHSNFQARCLPILFTQPRLILEPGLVNIQISNRTANTIFCQWLLHFAEPCRVIIEEQREQELAMIEAHRRARQNA